MSVFEELKRRNVFRVALAYLVLGWVVLQVTDVVAPALQLPEWTLRLVLWIGLIAFPFALFFAWAYELTPEGIQREEDVDRTHSITPHTAHKLDWFTIAMVAVGIAILLTDRFLPHSSDQAAATPARIEHGSAGTPTDVADTQLQVVAVLPFKATGSDDGGFLAAGLHDDLLTRLARLEAFKVISRTSMMEYADSTKNIRQIGEELGAAYILEGGVQARGERVRINAQLIHAPADEHLWADTYDRQLTADNLFDVQAELAGAIAVEMQTTLGATDLAMLQDKPTHSMEAYSSYLRGRDLWDRGEFYESSIQEGIDAFGEAVRIDPEFAQAWAYRSIQQSRMYQLNRDAATKQAAKEAQARAAALQPGMPEADLARVVYLYRVESGFAQALGILESLGQRTELDSDQLMLKAYLLRRVGRFEDSYLAALDAYRLNPRSVRVATSLVSGAYASGNCPAAAQHAHAALALAPESGSIRAEVAQYELNCTGDAKRASELMHGIDFAASENYVMLVARIAAEHQRDFTRLLELSSIPAPSYDGLGPLRDAMWKADALRRLGRLQEFEETLAWAGEQLELIKDEGVQSQTALYAFQRLRYHSMRGDVAETEHWIAEHHRVKTVEEKGDRAEEAIYQLLYALALAEIGFHNRAIEKLGKMFEMPGAHSFLYVDDEPGFDAIRDLPGYADLRARHAITPAAPSGL